MVLLYDIREAKVSEGSSVQHFLDSHWKKNHSLVLSRDLLDFQLFLNDSISSLP